MAERQAVTMESVVGTRVLIHLHREAYEMLEVQGIESERFVAQVLGIDGFGLWIENPSYCTIPVYDDAGQYIEPEKRVEVCHRAAVLIQWAYIQTVLQFPDRLNYRPSAGETEIGFRRHLLDVGTPMPGHIEAPGAGRITVPGGKGVVTTDTKIKTVAGKPAAKGSKEKKRG